MTILKKQKLIYIITDHNVFYKRGKKILNKHILVVDDDNRLRLLLKQFLEKHNFNISVASEAKTARTLLDNFIFDLIILDIMMPGESGIELLKGIRENNNVPILLLTALNEISDKLKGLKTGADDYLTKPFDPEELLLRINSILRRTFTNDQNNLIDYVVFGPYKWDEKLQTLSKDGKKVYLTSLESKLMSVFSQNHGEIINRFILNNHFKNSLNNRSIDVGITRLRKKIEKNSRQPEWLHTIHGKGWVLRSNPIEVL